MVINNICCVTCANRIASNRKKRVLNDINITSNVPERKIKHEPLTETKGKENMNLENIDRENEKRRKHEPLTKTKCKGNMNFEENNERE